MIFKREYGDYQTPLNFAIQICTFLKENKNLKPRIILDPTCGIGNFLKAAQIFNAEKYFGIEINSEYCQIATEHFSKSQLLIFNEDFFNYNAYTLPQTNNLLIIGNPPWATNSDLLHNLPLKNNFKHLNGLEALTGSSNFDISEYIIDSLIEKYQDTETIIAMLCKNSVARKIFAHMVNKNILFKCCEFYEFDAYKIFKINVRAGLLFIKLTNKNVGAKTYDIYDFNKPTLLKKSLIFKNGNFSPITSNLGLNFDGNCQFEWRQGIKHDCAKIMEIILIDGILKNGYGESVQLESQTLFPLVKGGTIKKPIINNFSKFVIVPQKFFKEDTSYLETSAPLTWKYLKKNLSFLQKRKSKIYKGNSEFAVFGIGDYSFLPYKICISGFNKQPFFSLVFSLDQKPVMLDDTSYFIGFEKYESAYVGMLYLNSRKVQDFLQELSFSDNKRPYTKKLLSRLDFSKICNLVSMNELQITELSLGLTEFLTDSMLKNFEESLKKFR